MKASLQQSSAIARFRALHESGCFVLPNPWDRGAAVYLERLGFDALATTSAGFAFTRALPDSVSAVSRDSMLSHIGELVGATDLPVNADFQNGYADDPETLAANVALCVGTGVAGLSIEDATGNNNEPLYDLHLAVTRVAAARCAIDDGGIPVLLTARCDAWLVGASEPLRVALERLTAFAEAGADCLYAPGVTSVEDIATIVKAVAPKPVNVLVSTFNRALSVASLAELGVRRISVGGALARVAWGAFMKAAREIREHGTFDEFADAPPFNEIQDLFIGRG